MKILNISEAISLFGRLCYTEIHMEAGGGQRPEKEVHRLGKGGLCFCQSGMCQGNA